MANFNITNGGQVNIASGKSTINVGETHWVSCKERMPECDSEIACLVTYIEFEFSKHRWSNRKVGIMTCINLQGDKMWNTKGAVEVLAWMYFPEPYNEGKL